MLVKFGQLKEFDRVGLGHSAGRLRAKPEGAGGRQREGEGGSSSSMVLSFQKVVNLILSSQSEMNER